MMYINKFYTFKNKQMKPTTNIIQTCFVNLKNHSPEGARKLKLTFNGTISCQGFNLAISEENSRQTSGRGDWAMSGPSPVALRSSSSTTLFKQSSTRFSTIDIVSMGSVLSVETSAMFEELSAPGTCERKFWENNYFNPTTKQLKTFE